MNIKTLKFSLFLLTLVTVMISCKNDDDINSIPFVEKDRSEQQLKDNDSILAYLTSHYYNSSFFETGSNHKYTDIIITKLESGEDVPDGNTRLLDAVGQPRTAEYLDVSYKYYVLNINQGEGGSPYFTDKVRVRYEGSSIASEEIFDSNVTPDVFNLQTDGFIPGVIKAWQLVMPTFNASSDFDIDVNGNFSFENFGLGVMFVPSGLGYFSGTNTGSSYDNLIFKFELLQFQMEDHDNDGVPSYLEDLDGDLDVTNDDTDGDDRVNFIDRDDDGDGVLTTNEVIFPDDYIVDTNLDEEEPVLAANEFERSRSNNNGIITIKTVILVDSNNDGTPDYLDENITISYN